MTQIMDPQLDETFYPLGEAPAVDPTVKALNRIAVALEQLVLNGMATPALAALSPLPPVSGIPAPNAQILSVCPIHNQPWKTVPAGISKKTGQPYTAFQACSVSGCDQRPPR